MVKISLQIRAVADNIDELYTEHPNYNFLLKMKCLNCGEVSDKWQDVMESQTYPSNTGKSEVHYMAKCKLCGRQNSLDIIEGSNGKFTVGENEDELSPNFKTLVTFDCRGLEPVEFSPTKGWIAKVEKSGTIFKDIDLSENEWVDYDERANQSVGFFKLQSQFVKVK